MRENVFPQFWMQVRLSQFPLSVAIALFTHPHCWSIVGWPTVPYASPSPQRKSCCVPRPLVADYDHLIGSFYITTKTWSHQQHVNVLCYSLYPIMRLCTFFLTMSSFFNIIVYCCSSPSPQTVTTPCIVRITDSLPEELWLQHLCQGRFSSTWLPL